VEWVALQEVSSQLLDLLAALAGSQGWKYQATVEERPGKCANTVVLMFRSCGDYCALPSLTYTDTRKGGKTRTYPMATRHDGHVITAVHVPHAVKGDNTATAVDVVQQIAAAAGAEWTTLSVAGDFNADVRAVLSLLREQMPMWDISAAIAHGATIVKHPNDESVDMVLQIKRKSVGRPA